MNKYYTPTAILLAGILLMYFVLSPRGQEVWAVLLGRKFAASPASQFGGGTNVQPGGQQTGATR